MNVEKNKMKKLIRFRKFIVTIRKNNAKQMIQHLNMPKK